MLFNETGRPELVYGKKCREDELEHEVLITEAELRIGGHFTRNVPVGKTTADSMTTRNGIPFYLEADNDNMTSKQMREKWERYGEIDGFILLVCRSRSRLRRLMKGASLVRKVIFFSRFKWLQWEKRQEAWIDSSCKRTGL